jgi:hypothetical protein
MEYQNFIVVSIIESALDIYTTGAILL